MIDKAIKYSLLLLKKVFMSISRNKSFQEFLEYNIGLSQDMMGIGTGSGVHSSGEFIIFQKMHQLIAPIYCIFDVGSNKGQFLNLCLSNLRYNKFHIHCFEPSLQTFKILCNNTPNNPNITFSNIGLGKEKGEFDLFFDETGSGLASLTKRRLAHFSINMSESEKVEIDTIDNYCAMNRIKQIDLLKIDVEGHELDVLYGANAMFQNNLIRMVSFEFGGCNIDTRTFFQDFFYFFKRHNMSIFRITPSGYLYQLAYYKELDEQFRTTNFLAISNLLQ